MLPEEISRRVAKSQGRKIVWWYGARVGGSTWRTQGRSCLAIREHAHAGHVDEDLKLPLTRKHWQEAEV